MTYFRRKLWFADKNGQHQLGQDDLLKRSEPVVVLGEPGMGKTELLKELAQREGAAFCRAQQLINRSNPATLLGGAHLLVIDALDEVSARSEGDAVDLVLRKLGELNYPAFVLSCRVGEWRAAISSGAIADQYGGMQPLEVHLKPLDLEEQVELLTLLTSDQKRARMLVQHFDPFGQDFLGNPQTLGLIATLPVDQELPSTSGALFAQGTETLWKELNPLRKNELPRDATLAAAGAAFAGLILCGRARIVDRPSGLLASEDSVLPLAEVEAFDSGNVRRAVNTKLFATDWDGWSYVHRRVGEFVGASWLAGQAKTRAKRARLLNLFRSHGLVPASLRGLHAWLARDPDFADAVIDADPMGVVEYGDAGELSAEKAKRLFAALERLALDNPRFGDWREYRASALVSPSLMDEVTRVIGDKKAEFMLRLFLLQQLKNAPTAEGLRTLLRERMLDEEELYGIRSGSASVLLILGGEDWPALLDNLRLQVQEDALRLAHELLPDIGIDVVSNEQIVEIVLARDGLTICPLGPQSERNTVFGFQRLAAFVPVTRLDGLLDLLTAYANTLLPEYPGIEENELIDFQYALVVKRLENGGSIEPTKIWHWLKPFVGQTSYQREQGKTIGALLVANEDVRRAIQRHVLIDEVSSKNVWQRAWPLHNDGIGLYPTQADVIDLLKDLDPGECGDKRWRDILELAVTWGDEGKPLREAAKGAVQHRPDLIDWIDSLAERAVPEWKREQERNKQQREEQRATRFARDRQAFLAKIEEVRAGQPGAVTKLAQVYVRRFYDVGNGVPAHQRVAEWLGEEIAAASRDGFEAYLQTRPARPRAKAIALNFAENKRYSSGDIIVAALAERVRTQRAPFESIRSERLAAGLFECWHCALDDHAGIKGLGSLLESELKRRKKWRRTARLFIEPQLRRGNQQVSHLWAIMRDPDANAATELAEWWLIRFPEMSGDAEVEMIDRLLRSNRRDALRALLSTRSTGDLGTERQCTWRAVGLIVDFEVQRQRLGNGMNPTLLLNLRARTGGRGVHGEDDGSPVSLSVDQLAWTIATFRPLWPAVSWSRKGERDDVNSRDASEFVYQLIRRLGSNVSAAAVAALNVLRDAPEDGYTWAIRTVAAEQRQKRADESYSPPTLEQIKAILVDGPPGSVADLRAIVASEIRELGKRLRGSSEDEVNLFWTDGNSPRTENECRDRLVSLLRGYLEPMSIYPASEADMPKGKRADIVFQYGRLLLPLEAKRQQHPELWTAIDNQLEAFYTGHWQAEGQGTFLVFWFGSDYPVPRRLDDGPKPYSAAELLAAFSQHPAVKSERVEAIVLDVSR